MQKLLSMIVCLLGVVFLLLAAMAVYFHFKNPGGKRISGYREYTGMGTNAPCTYFDIADFQRGMHMGPCGFGESVNWEYTISLSGEGDRFLFQNVAISSLSLPVAERIVGGEVDIDRAKNEITLAIKVKSGKKVGDFIGNGTFKLDTNR
jgi:hypothetical protein